MKRLSDYYQLGKIIKFKIEMTLSCVKLFMSMFGFVFALVLACLAEGFNAPASGHG